MPANGTWVGATAAQISRAVRRGDTTATAVIADHLDHARVADRILEALRALRDGAAIAEAEQVDELPGLGSLPLAGVPVLVKENTAVAGMPTWNGSAAARTRMAERDHEVVRRLRGAGAVVIGLSRMSELDLWGTTDDAAAITRNPWRSDRTAGGSSGGAAAAVSGGIVPIAHGTDGLGSVRIPAACCGLIGFKPGRVVLSHGLGSHGLGATGWFGLAEHGILATNVADAATAFAVLSGRDPVPLPDPGRLRVAVSTRTPVRGIRPDRGAQAAVARAARLLVRSGHDAVAADPRYPVRLALTAIAAWLAVAGRESEAADAPRLQQRTRWHASLGSRALRRGLVRPGARTDWRERCVSWFGGFDLLVTPTLAGPPPLAGRVGGSGWSSRPWWTNVATGLRIGAYTAPWNLAGLPALAVPMGVRRDGVPGSVQLVGPPGSELTLLAVAAQLERAGSWRPHAPGWPRARSAAARDSHDRHNFPAVAVSRSG